MKRAVIFNSSPRKNGITTQILDTLRQALQSKDVEVTYYELNLMDYRDCQACMFCKKRNVEYCPMDDDLSEVYDVISASNGIILGSPIYMYGITGQMKTFIDRLYPFVDLMHTPKLAGKKAMMVYSHGTPMKDAFLAEKEKIKSIFETFGVEVTEDISVGGNPPHMLSTLSPQTIENICSIGRDFADMI